MVDIKQLKNVTDRELILGLGYEVKQGNAQINQRIDSHENTLKEWGPTIKSLQPIVKIAKRALVILGGIFISVVTGIVVNWMKVGHVEAEVEESNLAIIGTEEEPGIKQDLEALQATTDVVADLSVESKASAEKAAAKADEAADKASIAAQKASRSNAELQKLVKQKIQQQSVRPAAPKTKKAEPKQGWWPG